jgi:parallel beta-helix repeat protein
MRSKYFLLTGLLLFLSPALRAATYYVDSLNGNDSNSGTSSSSPWRTLAKISSSKFAPGDVILLRKGSQWREQLNFPSSGSENSPIVIDAYGQGELPVINGANLVLADSWSQCTQCGGGIWQSPVAVKPNVVIFDGAKGTRKSSLTDLSAPLDWYWESNSLYVFCKDKLPKDYRHPGIESGARPSGINLTGISHVAVKDIAVSGANAIPYGEGAGIWAITVHLEGPTPGDLNISHVAVSNGAGDGIHLENANHCSVDSALVHDNDGAGIELYHSNGKFPIASGAITNNDVHHNGFNGIFVVGCPRAERCRSVVYPDGLTITGLKIIGNKLHDNGAGIYLHQTNQSLISNNIAYSNNNTSRRGEGYCVGLSGSSSNIVEKNHCYKARLSGIELSIDTGRPPFGSSENVIRYNVVHDDGTHGIFTNYVPSQHNRILYNLIYNHPQGSCIMANYLGHEIYNNTCYNSQLGIHLYVSSTTRQTGQISVKNNIIVRSSQHHVFIEPGVEGPFDFSNNDYYPDSAAAFNWRGTRTNFAAWQSGTGQDTKSLIADPAFKVSTPTQPPDFALRPASPAIGNGADLGADYGLAPFTVPSWPEPFNLLAQSNGRWDIGALHHVR